MTSQRREAADTALRERIASGDLKPGGRIGANVDAIADEYGVGKTTMQGILVTLAGEGLVRREHGIGYFVADNAVAVINGETGGGLAAAVRKLQEDVAGLKADVTELQSQRNISRAPRKRERSNEQSG
jgi:DNA-binding GntR family transcriptional regulator